jgi:hypothetical protein
MTMTTKIDKQYYTDGYTDYLFGLPPGSLNAFYLQGYNDQKFNTEVLGI